MDKEKQITMIRKTGVVAIIRAETSGDLVEAAEAINAGGG
jgi:2-keto-3-deoxy-6-phosphogluconate aldolase